MKYILIHVTQAYSDGFSWPLVTTQEFDNYQAAENAVNSIKKCVYDFNNKSHFFILPKG